MADQILRSEAREHFARIQKKASDLGLNNNDIIGLELIKKHEKPLPLARITLTTLLVTFLVVGVVCGLGYGSVAYGFVEPKPFVKFWAKYLMPTDLDQEQCLLPTTETMLDMFRPPQDCSFCEGISKEDRVANLSVEQFKKNHAYSGKVTVITDAMTDWTAKKYFSLKFFKKVYGPNSPVLESASKDCQFFRYKTDFNSVREVFNMPKKMQKMEGRPWYVGWSNCDAKAAGKLRQYYKRPYFFSDEMESSKTDWIFMGTPGYGAHMHIDNVRYPSWQAQVSGTKIWTIMPPPECYYKCPGMFKVTVNPGDIIVLDTNRWFHQTDIVGKNLSIVIGSEYD
eukprot:gene18162-19975_t